MDQLPVELDRPVVVPQDDDGDPRGPYCRRVDQRPLLERLRQHPGAVDAALAAVLLLVVLESSLRDTGGGRRWALAAVVCLLVVPLAWRRRAPVPAAAAVLAGGLAELVVSEWFLPANVGVVVMVHALAAHGPDWSRRAGLVLGLLGAVLAALRYFGPAGGVESAVLVTGSISVLVLAAWTLGDQRRRRLQQLTDLHERARLLELERDQEVQLAAAGERARIAREMHDVVAHSLSVVIAQADGGRYAAAADPAAAGNALETIAATGRQALADMRGLLGVLRDGSAADHAPQPDVAAVPGLVDDVRTTGLDVDLIVEGVPRPLPAGTELTAYRIVQESLTNVLKHAGPACRTWVRLHWREDALEVSVVDDGRGAGVPESDGRGQGIAGMRERARLRSGSLEAGPRHAGGFGVRAVLPYPTGGRGR